MESRCILIWISSQPKKTNDFNKTKRYTDDSHRFYFFQRRMLLFFFVLDCWLRLRFGSLILVVSFPHFISWEIYIFRTCSLFRRLCYCSRKLFILSIWVGRLCVFDFQSVTEKCAIIYAHACVCDFVTMMCLYGCDVVREKKHVFLKCVSQMLKFC